MGFVGKGDLLVSRCEVPTFCQQSHCSTAGRKVLQHLHRETSDMINPMYGNCLHLCDRRVDETRLIVIDWSYTFPFWITPKGLVKVLPAGKAEAGRGPIKSPFSRSAVVAAITPLSMSEFPELFTFSSSMVLALSAMLRNDSVAMLAGLYLDSKWKDGGSFPVKSKPLQMSLTRMVSRDSASTTSSSNRSMRLFSSTSLLRLDIEAFKHSSRSDNSLAL